MARNPYEDYDAIDPWADDYEEEPTGSGPFFEDSFDQDDPFAEGGWADRDDLPRSVPGVDDTLDERADPLADGAWHESVPVMSQPYDDEAFPRTVVRKPVGEAPRTQPHVQGAAGARVLRRRRRGESQAPAPVQQAAPVVGPPPARSARTRRAARPPRRRRHWGCAVWLFLIAAATVALYWVFAHPIDKRLAFDEGERQTLTGALSLYVPSTPNYILALGSDAREGDLYSRTDSMMLVRVDFWGGKVTLLSIPRDTMVEIDGYGTQKINAAYAFGGAGGAVRAVSKLCGVNVNHVAVVHFEELAGLVDYLGGVTVNVPTAVYDPDYTGLALDAGLQTLDGETALAWARTRYGYATGDFQRQENQRILLSAIVNRALSEPPQRIPGLIEKFGDLISTDLRCYNLVPLFVRFKLQAPVIMSASVPSDTATIDGVSYVIANEEALAQVMRVIDAGGDPQTLAY